MAEVLLPRVGLELVRAELTEDRVVVINRDPAPGEVGAPRDTVIGFNLVDLGDAPAINLGSVIVTIDGEIAYTGGSPVFGFDATTTSTTDPADRWMFLLWRDAPFTSKEVVAVAVEGETVDEEAFSFAWNFVVEDFTAPVLVAASDRGDRVLWLTFDEPVTLAAGAVLADDILIEPAEGYIEPAVAVVPLTATAQGNVLILTLARDLSPGRSYIATVASGAVVDAVGNPIGSGATAAFVALVPAAPAGRAFDLWSMLPAHNRGNDPAGDLRLLVSAWQEMADLLFAKIDRFGELINIDTAPEANLDAILYGLGNPFDASVLTLAEKRRLASLLVEMYRERGTAKGITNAIRLFLGVEAEVIPIGRTSMRLGTSILGVDWILGSDDPRTLYSFIVEVDTDLTPEQRVQLVVLVEYIRTAREHFVALVEPSSSPLPVRWILGTSELGVDAILSA